jgi:beta-glucosidase
MPPTPVVPLQSEPSSLSAASEFPFRNPALPPEARVDDLIARLTLPEKINQLLHENQAIERLGLPAYNWWSEACHGVARSGRATVFPQVIALAATWDRALVRRVASIIADEARAKHYAGTAANGARRYRGLTFWTPNVNILRDPRWGRGQETFGEDPFLTGELGLAMVRGLQGDDPQRLKVAACAKHFAVHSGPEAQRHAFDVEPTRKDLAETYLPAFEKLVRGGVEAVMGAYNRVFGEPACASPFLLGEILRGRWGFKGHVVSDCGAIEDFHRHHGVTKTAAESAALAVRRGCDLNCGCTFHDLIDAERAGLVTEAEIETSLRRLLNTKLKLGLLDSSRAPASPVSAAAIDSAPHRALAREAATESIVLLKNAGEALPLRQMPAKLLVVGPTAANINAMLGNYAGVTAQIVTFMEGIAERIGPEAAMEYRVGCPLSAAASPGINYTFNAAADADVVVAFLGLDPTLEGEEGDAVASTSGGDRAFIELPSVQRTFLRELRRHAKKLVLVLTGGGALAIPEEHDLCDAVLHAWYSGCEGGRALAALLFGDASPSGRLPLTVPRRTIDLPEFDDYRMRGRTYRYAAIEPLYPFGFGLSYGRLHYGALQTSTPRLCRNDSLTLRLLLSNDSDWSTDEVVQCYVVPPPEPDAPQATLIEFQRVNVPAHGHLSVEFILSGDAFFQIDAAGEKVWRAGVYQLVVGSASPGPRSLALGSPAPAAGTVELADAPEALPAERPDSLRVTSAPR